MSPCKSGKQIKHLGTKTITLDKDKHIHYFYFATKDEYEHDSIETYKKGNCHSMYREEE